MSIGSIASSPPPAVQATAPPPAPAAKPDKPNDGDADDGVAAAPKAPPPGQGTRVDVRV